MRRRPDSTWLWLGLIALYAFVHSAAYALTNPVFESPDEPGHLAFVNRMAAGGGLPNQFDPAQVMAEGHQNPLYYGVVGFGLRLAGGPISAVVPPSGKSGSSPQFRHDRNPFPSARDRSAFYALRLIGSLLASLAVLQCGRASRMLLPHSRTWWVAPLLAAALPQWAFIGGSISNDVMVGCLGACALAAAARCSTQPASPGSWLELGLWTGLAYLAKKNALCLVPAACLLFLVQFFLARQARWTTLRPFLYGALVASILIAPVLIRNWAVYRDPLGFRMELETLSNLVYPQSFGSRHFRVLFPDIVPRSFVAHFGWMIVEVAPKYVWVFLRGLVAAMLLSGLGFTEQKRAPMLAYAWAAFLANLLGLVYYNLFFPQAQGRLLFPSLPAVMLLAGFGIFEVSRRVSLPYKPWAAGGIALALLWFDWFALATNQAFYGR